MIQDTDRDNINLIDPSEMTDSWKLSEGFVAEEGKALLSHISKTRYRCTCKFSVWPRLWGHVEW